MFSFYTEVLKLGVTDRHGRWLGKPHDFIVNVSNAYPYLTHIVVKKGAFPSRYAVVPWAKVQYGAKGFHLRSTYEELSFSKEYYSPDHITLRTSIVDQQVVDTFNRKVVRVNDVHFLVLNHEFRLVHVDVGVRGIVRRLGWESFIDRIVKVFSPSSKYLNERGFISWKFVQPVSIQDASGRIKLNVEQEALQEIPPSDISEMLMELDAYNRPAMLKMLDLEHQVEILTELELKWQKDFFEDLDMKTAVDIFENMSADDATDLFRALSKRGQKRLLSHVSKERAEEVEELLEHEDDSAGGIMTTEFITLGIHMTVGEAIEHIRAREEEVETIHCSYIVDEEQKILGSILVRDLLFEPNEKKVEDLMETIVPSIHIDDSIKEVAFTFDKYNFFVAPVVDDENILQGIITSDDVLTHVIEEAYGEKSGI